ncbi:hypothetical protein [Tenacibaculum jejuense]|uniref:hypothetical protein n=1 Tax=Tenacibaculum jejuense TaxID=584609 RepID=UPI000BA41689|nr:hypothetical protein [Tenacibaculum jejuense]
MKKSILNLGKALNKARQAEVNGGIVPIRVATCDEVCRTAPRGTKCGPPHCPGVCNGRGGADRY